MHELAICQALLEQIEAIARQRAAKVARVRLAVGPLSGVDPRLLERAYPLACAGTMAEGSELAIEEVPVRVRCRDCEAESAASSPIRSS
jgi:hydrogenase nickel incorporation protein HypA/HybF